MLQEGMSCPSGIWRRLVRLDGRDVKALSVTKVSQLLLSLSDAEPRRIRCTPVPRICARFEESVREFTPIHEISDDRRPYSILGQRFITTLRPAASASLAASSLCMASCIQITCGFGLRVNASFTMGCTCSG